jgi:hypothetical protein
MDKSAVLRKLVTQFKYTPDSDLYKLEVWRVLRGNYIVGDCEDFALTLGYRLSGNSIIRLVKNLIVGRYKLAVFRHKETGMLHGALLDTSDMLFADNIASRWHDGDPLNRQGYYVYDMWSVFIIAKLITSQIILAFK